MRRFAVLASLATLILTFGCSSSDSKETPPIRGQATRVATATAGPQARIEPKAGPPGNQVVVSGAGWPPMSPVTITAQQNPTNAPPYAQVTTGQDGSFEARFRLEKAPDGTALKVGRFNLIARGAAAAVTIPFQVETARPVRNPGDGG